MTDGGNVVNLFETDVSVGEVLAAAADKGLKSVLVLGKTVDGNFYVASSGYISRTDALWLIDQLEGEPLGAAVLAELEGKDE